jgi:hypothetical protein
MLYKKRLHVLLTEGPLSQAAKQTLALNRLSRKQFNQKTNWSRALNFAVKREMAKRKIKTSAKRDIVRAATIAQDYRDPI